VCLAEKVYDFFMTKTKKRETGDVGEKIAGRFLRSKGFEIVGWNYLKPWGEIDIIVKKKGKMHFVEVKTISITGFVVYKTPNFLKKCKIFLSDKLLARPERAYDISEISSDEENRVDEYRPEDNLHPWKLKRLKRAITSYLSEKRMSEEDDWQFDAITVRIEEKGKTALVEYLGDIIL
jgi:Holliday junction resolvase-like predicted endonuclease